MKVLEEEEEADEEEEEEEGGSEEAQREGEVECGVLEGGAVGGEKSRTPPPLPQPTQQQAAASALHTLALNLPPYHLD